MTTTDIIRRCINRCAASRDGRGAWRAEHDCRTKLLERGTSDGTAIRSAAAARRLGEWLRTAA